MLVELKQRTVKTHHAIAVFAFFDGLIDLAIVVFFQNTLTHEIVGEHDFKSTDAIVLRARDKTLRDRAIQTASEDHLDIFRVGQARSKT